MYLLGTIIAVGSEELYKSTLEQAAINAKELLEEVDTL